MKQETIQKIYTWAISIFITACLVAGALWFAHEPVEEPMIGATSLSVDGETKDISYTDDNTDEDLIIKSDQMDYMNIGGSISVIFSIFNSSKDNQNITTAFSFSDGTTKYIRNLSEYDGEETNIIPGFEVSISSTTDEVIKRPDTIETITKWKPLDLEPFAMLGADRKDIKTTETKDQSTFFLKSGDTKFLKAEINFTDFIDKDEWFIEAFGDKGGYGHL